MQHITMIVMPVTPIMCIGMQGALRVGRFNPFEGWLGSESVGQDILISGRIDMNRSVKLYMSIMSNERASSVASATRKVFL